MTFLTSREYLLDTYARLPVSFKKGKGVYLWDEEGKKYLDFISGIGVSNLGHSHPRLVYALCQQASQLLHTSNLYHISQQADLAKQLIELTFPGRVFFCNSGGEANELAVKVARKWGHSSQEGRSQILVATKSFHGRSLGMIAASGQDKLRAGFQPTLEGFTSVPFGDITALRDAVGGMTCAIMLEPLQGEGGVNIPPKSYLKEVKDLCQEKRLLLILDEVQCGMGRTGSLFAFQQYDVVPDIVTMAKGLGGGVPIGATLVRDNLSEVMRPGDHGCTFGGNPLVSAAGLAVLESFEKEQILQNCQEMGRYFLGKLKELEKDCYFIKKSRGIGLMLAVDLDVLAKPIVEKCLAEGLLINAVQEKTLRFLPPLIIKQKQIDEGIEILGEVLETCRS